MEWWWSVSGMLVRCWWIAGSVGGMLEVLVEG